MSLVMVLLVALAGAYDNGAPNSRLPALGWSSWLAFGPGTTHPVQDYCDEHSVMAAADAFLDTGLYDAGYRHLHLDDCWSTVKRNATGHIQADPNGFPNGMKKVIDYVHSKNLTFGLYTSGGDKGCRPSRAGSRGHWQQDADVFAEWNVDWVKMDWCGGHDLNGSYTNMSRALNATGRPIGFNLCEWGDQKPWEWGPSVAQSWRISKDHSGQWWSTKSAIAKAGSIPRKYSGQPYGWNDMDMLETGNGNQSGHPKIRGPANMSVVEYITEFSMWAIAASPLLVTTPIMKCAGVQDEEKWKVGAAVPSRTGHMRAGTGSCTVSLTKQLSQKIKCELGKTFGCNDDGATMWVGPMPGGNKSRGCRGLFTCDGQEGITCGKDTHPGGDAHYTCSCSKPSPGPSPGPTPTPVNPPKGRCVGALTDVQKMILLNTEVIAVNQDSTPQGSPIVPGDLSVWSRKLTDGSIALALYNENDEAKAIGVPSFAVLGWPAQQQATVRDLWAHTDNGTAVGKMENITVEAHATVMLRLTPKI